MALFRKFFYRKPPDGLLEIVERVYVFDYCFTTGVMEEENYKAYIGGIVGQLCDHLPESSFTMFNYRDGEDHSQIGDILRGYDMTVVDYPRQYEGVPLLPMEMIHHCLKSGESWLTHGQNNVLLMHCERGGWPILAFMLAALLIYRKLYSGEQKTLDMIYKQAPRELLQLMSPLNPFPSQLRYLQYVSRRNLGSEWPPSVRVLNLDCIIIRLIPNMDGEGGCRPFLRIYGQDPETGDPSPKVLYSSLKRSKTVRHYKQGESELVKIDIDCHIKGDVVLECITLNEELERGETIFRIMFSTAFIRSNIVILNRDEIDIVWNSKDRFPKDFRAEVLFSEVESTICDVPLRSPLADEKEGLPVEAFDKVRDFFNCVDWDSQADNVPIVIEKIKSKILEENLEISSPQKSDIGILEGLLDNNLKNLTNEALGVQSEHSSEPILGKKLFELKSDNDKENLLDTSLGKKETASQTAEFEPQDADMTPKKAQTEDLLPGLQKPSQTKIISPRIVQSLHSSSSSHINSPQGSPISTQRFHGSPSSVGITSLLHDEETHKGDTNAHVVTVSPKSKATLVSSAADNALKLAQTPPPLERSASKNAEVPEVFTTPPSSPVKHPSSRPSMVESKIDSSFLSEISTSGKSDVDSQPTSLVAKKPMKATPPPPPPPPPLFEMPPPSIDEPLSSNDKSSLSTMGPPPFVAHVPLSTTSLPSTSRMDGGAKPPPPPPPPTLSASAPPPPPPPNVGSTNSPKPPPPPPPNVGSTNSPKAPPPPPAPFGKGAANDSSQQPQVAGSNGPVPPPPGPLGAKGRAPSRLSSRSHSQAKKSNLKPYHWLKLTRVMQGSLWAEAQRSDEASKAPEFDLSELENLFAASVPNSDKGAKSNRRASGPKSEKVQLVDLRRAYNCEIMLTKVKIPLPDLMNSVLVMDASALDVDQVENLIKFCPTKEEMEQLKNYKGDQENLGKCEQFFLELMKVPRVESKLRVFSFKIQFNTQVSDLRKNLNIVNFASEEIRTSAKLKRIMQTILSLGNALNHGTARGSAVGFRLDSLLKLTDTRARNTKMTLMHYLCKVLAEKMPELLDFSKDLPNLEAATKVQLKFLAEEMQAISKGLEKVVQELANSGNDGPVSESFRKILKNFLSSAEDEVRALASLYSVVGRSADALAMYFGEDPAKCPFEQVVSTLLNFVKMFIKAHDENGKQIELEKKKAEKEAENEKLKTTKESDQPLPSPRKFGTVK